MLMQTSLNVFDFTHETCEEAIYLQNKSQLQLSRDLKAKCRFNPSIFWKQQTTFATGKASLFI